MGSEMFRLTFNGRFDDTGQDVPKNGKKRQQIKSFRWNSKKKTQHDL